MSQITSLFVRDLRCFAGEQGGPTPRITLLVGKNGAGKSTFLGCYQTLAALANLDDLDDGNPFNAPPFSMGAPEGLVRTGCSAFGLRGTLAGHAFNEVSFEFGADSAGRLEERSLSLRVPHAGAEVDFDITRMTEEGDLWRFAGPGFTFDLRASEVSYRNPSTWLSKAARYGYLPYEGNPDVLRKREPGAAGSRVTDFARWTSFLRTGLSLPQEPSLLVEAPAPENPARARRHDRDPRTGDSAEVRKRVGRLGEQLDLFSAVRSVPDDHGVSVEVRTPGGWRNLLDVGYGVHAILPLLRRVSVCAAGSAFLLQQPEAHLHPSAQAALAQIMAESGHRFLVETHSDHFVDRFRICAMNGSLDPDDLGFLYFEPSADATSAAIHPIRVDEDGNLSGEPPEYRRFFLKETNRLLGFED